jgi:ferredoxin--NADP+ reductase
MENSILTVNTFTPKKHLEVECVKNLNLNNDADWGETRHLTFKIPKGVLQWQPGQSVGIIPPGQNAKGRANTPRLYSVASIPKPYEEDPENFDQLELCVKRVSYLDENQDRKFGLASNHLCDRIPGKTVKLTGPLGRHFLFDLNNQSQKDQYVLMATGTGIAPFRAFIEHWVQVSKDQSSTLIIPKIWLILGVRDSDHLLYQHELKIWQQHLGDKLTFNTVCSREDTAYSRRMYIGDYVKEHRDAFWNILKEPHGKAYMCGIKGMEEGIDRCMDFLFKNQESTWSEYKDQMIKDKRWFKEVY